MKMSARILLALTPLAMLASSPSCQPAFAKEIPPGALKLTITESALLLGTPTDRLPISFTTPRSFTVRVEADDENGALDKSFQGFVRFSLEPGSVVSVSGNPNSSGRNVRLVDGVADNVVVSVLGAYGDSRIWVEDLGYVPANPAGATPPQCANGIDDNHNGLIDYPVDPGCYAANDDSEDGGTYAGAVSGTISFVYPRIADVRGVNNSGGGTPFPNEQVQVDTRWNGTTTSTPKGVVVVGIGASGFFVTDIGETRGFASLYGYTYTAPSLMYVCDRLINFGGTSADFYGFTEMNYPTWSLEEWDPTVRPCLVPEPSALDTNLIGGGTGSLTTLEAGLVQVPPAGCSGLTLCCNSASFAATATQIDCATITDRTALAACVQGLVARCNAVAAAAGENNAKDPETACAASLERYATPVTIPGGTTMTTYCAASTAHVAKNFGPTLVPYVTATDGSGTVTIPAGSIIPGQTNCDYLGTGKIDFTNAAEAACETACTANGECTEYANFVSQQQFLMVVQNRVTCGPSLCASREHCCTPPALPDAGVPTPTCTAEATACAVGDTDQTGTKAGVFANGSASASFNMANSLGADVGAFTGDLEYFSGGSQFTITARCADDVILSPAMPDPMTMPYGALPLPSNTACVVSRAIPDTAASN